MKLILLLYGAAMSLQLVGMELVERDKEGSLWPRHLTSIIIENRHYAMPDLGAQFFILKTCKVLACVNKEFSEDIHYEKELARAKKQSINPLDSVIYRMDLGVKKDRYLKIAERFLVNGFNPNSRETFGEKCTLLQKAAYRQYKELCTLFLEHGGDPYLTTVRCESQGPCYQWDAFDYANKSNQYGEGDKEPHGWLKDRWDEVQREKQIKNEMV